MEKLHNGKATNGMVGLEWIEGARRLSEEGRLAWLLGRGLLEVLDSTAEGVEDAGTAAIRLGEWVRRAVRASEELVLTGPPVHPMADRTSTKSVLSSTLESRVHDERPRWEDIVDQRLGDRAYPVVFIGSRRIRNRWASLALGVDLNGRKHVLGARDDAAAETLIRELGARGLGTEGDLLVVSEGNPPVDEAAGTTWRGRARVQHCLYRLRYDLREQTPASMHTQIDDAIQATEWLPAVQGRERLVDLLDRLCDHPGAAARLERSLDAALTVARLGVSDLLRKHLQAQGIVRAAFANAITLGRPGASGLEAITSGIGTWLQTTRRFYAASELPDLANRLHRAGQEP